MIELARKKAEKILEKDGVIYFKATKPLTKQEHEQLSDKVRYESEKTELKIVLVPFSCDLGGEE
ncbi:hypothetical protein [Alkaliphilus metalliredigens]|uniref:hypothetical protein n=1 Tax=Alkaliphilus metalliredigens TaxID=208226 RepID=UPI0038CC15C2